MSGENNLSILPPDHLDHPDNPAVLAAALQLYKASYRDSKPTDNPTLWQVHVEHVRKRMKGLLDLPKIQKGAAVSASPEAVAAAKRAEDLLNGIITIGDVVVAVPPAAAEAAKDSLAPAAAESKTAHTFAIESGLVQPGVYNAPE